MAKEILSVLDNHGYVHLVDHMGDDLRPVNAAKVSYDRASTEFGEKEERLLGFLSKAKPTPHSSPFRHAMLQFEVYAPLMVARQWWKYIIGSGHRDFDGGMQDPFTAWNESSRRYVTEEPEFYLPNIDQWRSAPDNKKQGSGDPIPTDKGEQYTILLDTVQQNGIKYYVQAMEDGICAEQARLFLPAYGLYVRWYWTASLQGVAHFLNQRLAHDAQKEIQLFSDAVYMLTSEKFPVAIENLLIKE